MFSEDRFLEKVINGSDPEKVPEMRPEINRMNPRYLFIDPDSDFGRNFYQDLLMEMQEQM